MDLQSALQGFLGAVFGSLLIPFVNYYLEKRKYRVKLRLELIAQVHTIHQLFKAEVSQQNLDSIFTRYYELYNIIVQISPPGQDKSSAIASRENYAQSLADRRQIRTELFNQLIQLEADLVKSVVDVQGTYGYNIFLKINSIVEPILSNASNRSYFLVHDYSSMGIDQLIALDPNLNRDLETRYRLIDKDCASKKELLNALLVGNDALTFWDRFTSTKLWALITFKWAARD